MHFGLVEYWAGTSAPSDCNRYFSPAGVCHFDNKAFDMVGWNFPLLGRATETPVTYDPVCNTEIHSLSVPKGFLEILGNKTWKGGFALLTININPRDVSASQRASRAEESILTVWGVLNWGSNCLLGDFMGRWDTRRSKWMFFRMQSRDQHLPHLFSLPVSAEHIVCRELCKTQSRGSLNKPFPVSRSFWSRAGSAKSAPGCFCTAWGPRTVFRFFFNGWRNNILWPVKMTWNANFSVHSKVCVGIQPCSHIYTLLSHYNSRVKT